MNKLEWMPVNPCPCGAIRYPDGHKCNAEDGECSPLAYYEGVIDYQGKLLEYLIANCGTIRPVEKKVVTKNFLESMLKQLIMDKSMIQSEKGQLIDRGSFAKYVEKINE